MTKDIFSQLLTRYVDTYSNAFIVGVFGEKEILYRNHIAEELYGISEGVTDLEPIFKHHSQGLMEMVREGLDGQDLMVWNNITTQTSEGGFCTADIQIGFFDQEKTLVCIEIIPKNDTRMETAVAQVNQSIRAEGILNFDEKLSLIHCNDLFHAVFESNEDVRHSHFGNDFSNGFQPEIREELLADIQKKLTESDRFTTRMKIITSKGKALWYSLELHRRTLDNSGTDKIMAYMVNVERQVAKDAQLEDITQYFSILQSMCKGLLYRFDIRTRTLYRNEETAKIYNVPAVAENFPSKEWLEEALHSEDVEGFIAYVERVVLGQEGSHTARLRTPSGEKEYHTFTFKPIYRADGSVKEMVGCATNVHNLKETQKELENLNQYFHILQSMSSGMLYRFDIKKRILYRNKTNAHSYQLPAKGENYPDIENLKNVIHPEDLRDYVDFIERVILGQEGSLDTRVKTPTGEYEYHRMTFKPLLNNDGTIKEMIGKGKNIHYIKKTEQELENINQYFCAIQDLSDDLLYRIDIKNKSLIRREKVDGQANLFGANIVATNFPESVCENGFIHPEDAKTYIKFGHKALKGIASMAEVRMKSKSGEFGFRRIIAVPVMNVDGTVNEMLGKVVNIDGVRQLEQQAQYDDLTQVLNKRAMLERTSECLSKSIRDDIHALLFIDLDDFKYVNDNLGHAFGDHLLKELGARLKENTRHGDLVGRVGGDEFVVFLRNIPSEDMLMGKAKMLLAAISEDIVQGDNRHSIHGSIGIAVYPEHGEAYEELYHHADIGLYRSKHHGKNIVTMYNEDLENEK
ncbi:MAG: diguanylate cyclase [Eubacteriales bacterium]